jgi:hypothetical protein
MACIGRPASGVNPSAPVLFCFPAYREITLYVLAGAGHNHNVEPGHEQLWAKIIGWAGGLSQRRAGPR